ncbi:hypothetical protein ACFSTD_03600 [Novosphingobium colocasiae]
MRSRLLGGTALALGAVLLCATTDAPLLPYGVLGPTVGARLPGFAADLAQRPAIVGGAGWAPLADALAWDRLITADTSQRQAARWDYARSLIGAERGPEAIGVLEAMRQDDPDLGMVDAWRLAHGAALTLLGRSDAALAELDMPGLATNPEACLWRMRALAGGRDGDGRTGAATDGVRGARAGQIAPCALRAGNRGCQSRGGPARGDAALAVRPARSRSRRQCPARPGRSCAGPPRCRPVAVRAGGAIGHTGAAHGCAAVDAGKRYRPQGDRAGQRLARTERSALFPGAAMPSRNARSGWLTVSPWSRTI